MTMTNAEMASNIEILSQLKEKGKLGYAIARNIRKLRDAAKEYMDLRDKLFQEYGHSVGGSRYAVDKDKLEDFLAALNVDGIPGIEHDFEAFQVDEETFYGGGLNSQQMSALMWMAKEE